MTLFCSGLESPLLFLCPSVSYIVFFFPDIFERPSVSLPVIERWKLLFFPNKFVYAILVYLHPLCRYFHLLCWCGSMAPRLFFLSFLLAPSYQSPTCWVQIYIWTSYVDSDPYTSVMQM